METLKDDTFPVGETVSDVGEIITTVVVVHGKFSPGFISRGKGHVHDPLYPS
jgi:hypothetical protein